MVENDEAVAAALRAGARGYLVKGASKQEITRALEAAGARRGDPRRRCRRGVLSRLVTRGDALAPFQQLSEREREVLDLVARGLTNGAIAQELYLSEKTVRNVVSSILTKLPAATRAEAVARARDAGMGGASPSSR